ncbi:hypothetical protein RHSIM_Rhsim13G0063800 [Rhododendron simsii]|uniref:GDSL esterase/lipase n=1 Tax=Rhododendron simsii TaxID=118357 RepID=A0A834FXM4_RHOSS|nr:hypothetical protein RHSIM_Rhsim13G0063800 [Rhododendron simsii]
MKSNHPPYGKDFLGHVATGRFSDGKIISDFAASILGIKDTVPRFLDPKLSDEDIRTGTIPSGDRSIVVAGLPPIGCLPLQITVKLHLLRTCVDQQNSDAKSYNQKLASQIPRLESSLPESKIIYADIYTPLSDMDNPHKYGLMETRRGCCGTGLLEAGPLCSALSPVCPTSSTFLFWDGIHPTESAYRYLSEALEQQIGSQLLQKVSNH